VRGDFDVTAQRGVEGARVPERGLVPKIRRKICARKVGRKNDSFFFRRRSTSCMSVIVPETLTTIKPTNLEAEIFNTAKRM